MCEGNPVRSRCEGHGINHFICSTEYIITHGSVSSSLWCRQKVVYCIVPTIHPLSVSQQPVAISGSGRSLAEPQRAWPSSFVTDSCEGRGATAFALFICLSQTNVRRPMEKSLHNEKARTKCRSTVFTRVISRKATFGNFLGVYKFACAMISMSTLVCKHREIAPCSLSGYEQQMQLFH